MDLPPPSPLNSACDCCNQPYTPAPLIEFRSIQQDCIASNCGEEPCTSGSLPLDLSQVCIPNYEDLTDAEKCANPRYLVKTFTDTDGHQEVTTYTVNPDTGECTSETVCSGTQTTEVRTEYYDSSSYVGGSYNYEHDVTETTVKTWNADCTITEETTCSGTSNTTLNVGTDTTTPYTLTCNSTIRDDCSTYDFTESCSGVGCDGFEETSGSGESCVEFAVDGGTFFANKIVTTTITPEPTSVKTYEYSQLNELSICTPPTLPEYPSFVNCTPEGEEPVSTPELATGQAYQSSAYQYINPNNEAIKSIRKVSYRVVHKPVGTCYLKVWFRKKIQPYKYENCDTGFVGDPPRTPAASYDCDAEPCSSRWSTNGPPTYENGPMYEWEGSGYPCIPDKAKLPSDCENNIYGESTSYVLEAAEEQNAVITLEYKWSAVKNYEPNWQDENGSQGCKPNGFPIPDPAACPAYNE